MSICCEPSTDIEQKDFYHRFTQSYTDFTTDWTRENINLCESVIICGEPLEILTRRDFYHRFTQSYTDFTTDWLEENNLRLICVNP